MATVFILLPDDPVFYAKFQSLEQPLLHHLHRLHRTGRNSDEERIVADAYDSWVRVLLQLPLWTEWRTAGPAAGTAGGECRGYVLFGARGDQLTSLYPVETAPGDLERLRVCLDLFTGYDRSWPASPAQAGAGTTTGRPDRERTPTAAFRRVVQVLLFPPPRRLLAALSRLPLRRRGVSVTLGDAQEAEYRGFCENLVTVLSAGDTFAYQSHRAMYF